MNTESLAAMGAQRPFANLSLQDNGLPETATVLLSQSGNGGLSNLGGGTLSSDGLTYSISGSVAQVQAALQGLVFTPVLHLDTPVHPVTVGLTLNATDGSAQTQRSFSVTFEDGLQAVHLQGTHDQYIIAQAQDGSLYVQDTVANRDGTKTIANAGNITFADGSGRFDPTGQAEEITRLYRAAFQRLPDAGGLDYWVAQEAGTHIAPVDVASTFADSAEFKMLYGSLSNDALVRQLYQNVLGRQGDAGGIQYWDNAMAQGASRGTVLLGFADSAENKANTRAFSGDPSDGEAYRLYQAALSRGPDASGLQYWSGVLSSGASEQSVAQDFVNSSEFAAKYGALDNTAFVSQLYQNVLHRAGDSSGMQYWTDMLNSGQSRGAVLAGFADGIENRVNTAAATHDSWVFLPQ